VQKESDDAQGPRNTQENMAARGIKWKAFKADVLRMFSKMSNEVLSRCKTTCEIEQVSASVFDRMAPICVGGEWLEPPLINPIEPLWMYPDGGLETVSCLDGLGGGGHQNVHPCA